LSSSSRKALYAWSLGLSFTVGGSAFVRRTELSRFAEAIEWDKGETTVLKGGALDKVCHSF